MSSPRLTADSTNLNVLRAIAVSAVFVSHIIQYCSPYLKIAINLGMGGVLLFFVHTSLVLMLSLERQGEGQLWRRFMVRRVFRIYPLSVCAVLIYAAWNVPTITGLHSFAYPDRSVNSLVPNLLLVQNLFRLDSVPGVLWSLPFEIQMYLVLPGLFLLAKARKSSDIVALWVVGVAASLMIMALAPRWLSGFAQFVPCFTAGVLAYSIPRRPRLPGWLFPVAVISLVGLMLLANPTFMIAEWPLCFALGCAIPFFRELPGDGPVAAVAAAVAKYSYAIYLFHGLFLCAFLPRYGVAGAIPAALLTGVTSVLCYHLLESPYIQLGRELTRRKLARAAAVA